jgi:hypothetical protein
MLENVTKDFHGEHLIVPLVEGQTIAECLLLHLQLEIRRLSGLNDSLMLDGIKMREDLRKLKVSPSSPKEGERL